MTLSITLLCITILNVKGLFATLSIKADEQNNILIEYHNDECHYAESRILFTVRHNAFVLSVVLLSVIALYFEPSHIMFSGVLAYLSGASYSASL
jgi:hypothetical protein